MIAEAPRPGGDAARFARIVERLARLRPDACDPAIAAE